VLLVGDSTLGYSVDATQWSKDLNRSVVSVALTGIYGFGGSLNMIRRATHDHAVSTIVIMHTPQLALRPPSYEGYLYTAPSIAAVTEMPMAALWEALFAMVPETLRLTIVRHLFAPSMLGSDLFPSDYIAQGPSLSSKPEPAPRPLSIDHFEPGTFDYLRQVAETCRASRIRCIYLHGPLTDAICRHSTPYFKQLAASVAQAGLEIVAEPTCMPWQDTGDEFDHLVPAKKAEYSRRTMKLIQPLLSP
jgi:hypothetical protein